MIYLIFSFNDDKDFRDVRNSTDKLANDIWNEWITYNNK